MDPDAPWQGSPEAAPGKAVEAEHEAASRSYVRREGDDARGGRVRDAIIEVARATEFWSTRAHACATFTTPSAPAADAEARI